MYKVLPDICSGSPAASGLLPELSPVLLPAVPVPRPLPVLPPEPLLPAVHGLLQQRSETSGKPHKLSYLLPFSQVPEPFSLHLSASDPLYRICLQYPLYHTSLTSDSVQPSGYPSPDSLYQIRSALFPFSPHHPGKKLPS